jgi:hypothetical protein
VIIRVSICCEWHLSFEPLERWGIFSVKRMWIIINEVSWWVKKGFVKVKWGWILNAHVKQIHRHDETIRRMQLMFACINNALACMKGKVCGHSKWQENECIICIYFVMCATRYKNASPFNFYCWKYPEPFHSQLIKIKIKKNFPFHSHESGEVSLTNDIHIAVQIKHQLVK